MKLLYLVESGESKFLVFDEMPDKISTKYGDDTIIGRIGGIFYDFLAKRNERREAFGGRKFDIVLDNGEITRVYYQKEHQRITNNIDSGQWLIVTDATGDGWGKVRRAPVQGRRGLHHMA